MYFIIAGSFCQPTDANFRLTISLVFSIIYIWINKYRQFRTKIVAQPCSELFRQIVQNDGKSCKRMRGKARSAVFARCCL